jgi:ribulose kinase
VAQGRYINDDGVTLNLTGNVNQYGLHYKQDFVNTPNTIQLDLTHDLVATNYPNNTVNMNDAVNSIQIYNAQAMGLNSNYTVSVTLLDGNVIPFGEAAYQSVNDRLVFLNEDAG